MNGTVGLLPVTGFNQRRKCSGEAGVRGHQRYRTGVWPSVGTLLCLDKWLVCAGACPPGVDACVHGGVHAGPR